MEIELRGKDHKHLVTVKNALAVAVMEFINKSDDFNKTLFSNKENERLLGFKAKERTGFTLSLIEIVLEKDDYVVVIKK